MHQSFPRSASVLLLAFAVTAASGCHWFHRHSGYQKALAEHPLEVPPGLDQPDTSGAMGGAQGPVTASAVQGAAAGPAAQPAASATSFSVPGTQADVFTKVGDALSGIQGVTIASKAQIMGVYDIGYQGTNFLVRVAQAGNAVNVSAVDPRGVAAGGSAPQLMAALKSALA